MNMISDDQELDQTVPPLRALRFDSASDLYSGLPEVSNFTKSSPTDGEDALAYFERLRSSSTPEDAITYIAFAMEPAIAVRWGLESVRTILPDVPAEDAQLMAWITHWLDHPVSENRWRTLQVALFAPRRSAAVYLGLAVGWSGGSLAPNDPVHVPRWRSPQAVNAAVLRALGQVSPEDRPDCIVRVLDLAAGLFRVY